MTRWLVGDLVQAAGLTPDDARLAGDPSAPIVSIAYDSRQVTPGAFFVALRGSATDGHAYLGHARERGAVACVVESEPAETYPCTVKVPDSRAALARISAAFYGHPSQRLGLIGVTGTKGKTTTTFLLEALLAGAGFSTGLIGTVELKVGTQRWRNPLHQTTPESLDVQGYLAGMVAAGTDWAVLETSSHALATHRVDGCVFDLVGITNITHEHLDFHGTFAAYREAKASLLERLSAPGSKSFPRGIVLNADAPAVYTLRDRTTDASVLLFGDHERAAVRALDVKLDAGGASFELRTPWGASWVTTPLLGRFNVYNVLAAVALAGQAGADFRSFPAALAAFAGVPGRLMRIEAGQPFLLIVDYAHNPDSLEQVLTLLRGVTVGRLLVLFGSGGERDRIKRGVMGGVAIQLADFAVFTDEDPRREDPLAILDEIAAGAVLAGGQRDRDFEVVQDRRTAIGRICELARPGDTVVLCGKGHEQTIEYPDFSLPWDEAAVARDVLARIGYTGEES